MAESRTFSGVSPGTWERLKALGREKHGTEFEPIDANHGKATTQTPFGRLVLDYALDREAGTITYTVVSKPMLVVSPLLWSGIEAAIRGCREETA